MKKIKFIKKCAAIISSLTVISLASTTGYSGTLNTVEIKGVEAGELTLEAKQFSLTPWHSKKLSGKARTILHMAGRKSARKMQDHFIQALKAAKFDSNYYQTTSIVDLSDAIWGTRPFVESKLEENKRKFPWSSIVLDRSGQFRAAHELSAQSSAVYILDANGEVLFSQEGALSPQEIDTAINLLQTEVARLKAQQSQES